MAGKNSDLVPRNGSDVQRIADAGETIYFDGVGALFDGVPDVMHVLRWKGIYERLWESLDRCARGATVLEQLARANADLIRLGEFAAIGSTPAPARRVEHRWASTSNAEPSWLALRHRN